MLCCNVRASCFRSKYSKKKCLLALFPKRIITCFCKLVATFLRTSKIYLYIAFARGDRTFFSRCRVLMAVVRVSLYLATSSLRVVLRCIPTTLSATAATQFFPKQSLHPDAFLLSFSSLVLYPSPPSCLWGQSLSRHARGKPFLWHLNILTAQHDCNMTQHDGTKTTSAATVEDDVLPRLTCLNLIFQLLFSCTWRSSTSTGAILAHARLACYVRLLHLR